MDAALLQRFLLNPESYPERPLTVTSSETHISRLFFTADRVYKIKKSVNFGFLDFTSLAKRRFFCAEELRLNRRFAPGTYERVAVIRNDRGTLNFDGRGRAIEYAVVMRRLPEEYLLHNLLRCDDPRLPAEIERLGRHLAILHGEAPVCRAQGDALQAFVMHRNWQENFDQLQALAGSTLQPQGLALCRDWIESFFAAHHDLLVQREAEGLVRDGHGDLHAEHICLTDPIRIYDCIEFNRRFRVGDILSDLAFLLMDLDFRGHPELAERLQSVWLEECPSASPPPQTPLLRFYRIYRAFVRGKVDSFLAEDGSAPRQARSTAASLARQYFNLALGYLVPPTLFITCGLMGVGKSTVARQLARALRAPLLRSDEIRKELAGIPAAKAVYDDFAAGLYHHDWNERTYSELLVRTQTALQTGQSVVVDAAFSRRSDRQRFAAVASKMQRPLAILYLCGPRAMVLQRLAQRQEEGHDPSDGRPELLERQAAIFEPPSAEESALTIDAAAELDYNVQTVLLSLLTRHGTVAP